MVFQGFSFAPVEEKQEFDQETEDTLSLSDLPLHSKASDDDNWEYDFSKDDDRSSSFEDDLFEFFSEDFTSSTYCTDKNSVIFCGKLIPYKGAAVAEKSQRKERTEKKKNNSTSTTFLSWKPKSLKKSRTMHDGEKVSILATPMKSRWYLFAFGVGRFPSMEMSEMKKRQSKKSTPAARGQVVSSPTKGTKISRSRSSRSLWSLLGVLGCSSSSSHHTTNCVLEV